MRTPLTTLNARFGSSTYFKCSSYREPKNEQRRVKWTNGKRQRSIWRVSMCSDLLLWSNEPRCLLVSTDEWKVSGWIKLSAVRDPGLKRKKMHQLDKGKDLRPQIKIRFVYVWIFLRLACINLKKRPKTLSNPSDLGAMEGRCHRRDSWDTNRPRVLARKRNAAG